ncbi:MAG: hypothetical protein V4688_00765 [Pseudomonadota bacterium]
MAATLTVLAGPAQAVVTLNAGTKLSYDNNVNGSPDTPTKANQRGDSYLTLNASAVYYTPLNVAQTRYFISQIGATSSVYQKFDNLDSSMLVASAGLWQQLSPTWSGQITGRGFTRDTQQTDRNANGAGGTLELKKQLRKTLWVKGVVDYEHNKANLDTFSYAGHTYGVNLGYLPFKDTFINLGYSHTNRDFKSTAPFESNTHLLFAEVSQRLAKNWYLNGGYAYADNDSNYSGTAYTNHIVSVGVSFSY